MVPASHIELENLPLTTNGKNKQRGIKKTGRSWQTTYRCKKNEIGKEIG